MNDTLGLPQIRYADLPMERDRGRRMGETA